MIELRENLKKVIAIIVEETASCDFYTGVYMDTTSLNMTLSVTSREKLHRTLGSALPELYAAILVLLAKLQIYLSPSTTRK